MTIPLNRRNFLRGSAAIGAASLATPALAANHTTT
ncbi:twin-arginine translocation signal domain-containing protein [Candidatus Halocynthiibacter alkanivorans]|nr:twin-arginine translocation signal domain-containing protein [Candidatus Halocynthiibacter alkanivorans]